jgi:4-hydroxybenzoate polyprenyltransferase
MGNRVEEYAADAGDDQVGALDLRAAVRADRRGAGGGWMAAAAVLGWIVVCMVSARSAAMAFNRLVDARLDAANPRTAMRALPAGG